MAKGNAIEIVEKPDATLLVLRDEGMQLLCHALRSTYPISPARDEAVAAARRAQGREAAIIPVRLQPRAFSRLPVRASLAAAREPDTRIPMTCSGLPPGSVQGHA